MSQVPGDLHPKLVKSFPELLVEPITKIFNKITSSSVYPCQWKEEHQVPIPKVEMPESEDDLRNIAKTAFFSKVYESFVADWLLNIIGPYFDPNQYGVKGLSTTHYLIKFLHFIQSQMDQKRPHAVLALYLDLSKAYNRVNHSLVIEDLYLMHTPAWLMKIVFSYLSQRSMVMNYMGTISNPRTINGGTPQGAFLGGIIFMIKFKGALLRPPIPRPLTESLSKSKFVTVKYVDNGSAAVSIDLKCSLKQDLQRERPLNFHERTHHYLPPSENLLQYHMQDAESFAKENDMKVNQKKTSIMLFNKAKKWDFPPELVYQDGSQVEVIEETKLVGVMLTRDLKWESNTNYICKKARNKLWLLRRIKQFGLGRSFMFDLYTKEIRSLLEMCVPVWHSGLTNQQSNSIERIQKMALRIILGERYLNYKNALDIFGTQSLHQRRNHICTVFARKNLKSDHSFFEPEQKTKNTRRNSKIVKEFTCRSSHYSKSSLPFLAKLINQS